METDHVRIGRVQLHPPPHTDRFLVSSQIKWRSYNSSTHSTGFAAMPLQMHDAPTATAVVDVWNRGLHSGAKHTPIDQEVWRRPPATCVNVIAHPTRTQTDTQQHKGEHSIPKLKSTRGCATVATYMCMKNMSSCSNSSIATVFCCCC